MKIKRNILLNPGPATTTDSVKQAQLVPDICPREQAFGTLMQEVCASLVKIVHGNPEEYAAVLFCGSGTICMDVCLSSLLPQGKRVLIVNNGVYSRRAVEICQYYQLPHIDLQLPEHLPVPVQAVEAALEENSDIALVYTTHNETCTGVLNPIGEMGAVAHRHGALFVVDTTSTFALRPIDMVAENIDFCMSSAQKGIAAMTGLSFVIGNREAIERSKDCPKRSYYCNLYAQYSYFKENAQMRFTPPVQTLYAVHQALKEYFLEGEAAKWARHKEVYQAIVKGVTQLGFSLLIQEQHSAQLVATIHYPNHASWDFDTVHDYCYQRGFTIYPGKIAGASTFRLCALGAIVPKDIAAFFEVFTEVLEQLGVKMPIAD